MKHLLDNLRKDLLTRLQYYAEFQAPWLDVKLELELSFCLSLYGGICFSAHCNLFELNADMVVSIAAILDYTRKCAGYYVEEFG